MPAGQERILRRRIRSVQSTQKITRAMELIAASRIVRAQQAMAAAKPYAERMQEVVSELAATPEARAIGSSPAADKARSWSWWAPTEVWREPSTHRC